MKRSPWLLSVLDGDTGGGLAGTDGPEGVIRGQRSFLIYLRFCMEVCQLFSMRLSPTLLIYTLR